MASTSGFPSNGSDHQGNSPTRIVFKVLPDNEADDRVDASYRQSELRSVIAEEIAHPRDLPRIGVIRPMARLSQRMDPRKNTNYNRDNRRTGRNPCSLERVLCQSRLLGLERFCALPSFFINLC